MRLVKYLARAGVASRRNAELIIREGRVRINGMVTELPQADVDEAALVTVDGKVIEGPEKKIYLLLNKPAGYISTVQDTHDRPTVTSLIKDIDARLYPVGRLDADTRGALLLTNDGELAYRLTHPRFEVKKVYRAWVKGLPNDSLLAKMKSGLVIDSEKIAAAAVKMLKKLPGKNKALIEITLTEGRKRQVKRMCASIGHPVRELSRTSFAGLAVSDLDEGSYRHLQKNEIEKLYCMVNLHG